MVAKDNLPKHGECNQSGGKSLRSNSKMLAIIQDLSHGEGLFKIPASLRNKNLEISKAESSEN